MAEAAKKETTTEWVKKWGKKGFFAGIILLIIAIFGGMGGKKKSNVEAVPAVLKSDRAYSAAYNFSEVTGNVASETFKVPAGSDWVYVALPAYYTATFSSATAKAGELDKLDGGKPIAFGKHTKFGDIPLAVAIRVPEGCNMTVSMIYDPTLKGDRAVVRKVSSKKYVRHAHKKDLPVSSDIPSGP